MKNLLLAITVTLLGFQQFQPQQRLGEIGILTAQQKAVLSHLSIQNDTLRITGVNVQIVNGTGSSSTINGTGNLTVGYNEFGGGVGSHNLIIGRQATYNNHSGFVGGQGNTINGAFASIVGGEFNTGNGENSVISGGVNNFTLGSSSVVVGGTSNQAFGLTSVVSGGELRGAFGTSDWVAGSLFEDL